jgi:hypothetical protein
MSTHDKFYKALDAKGKLSFDIDYLRFEIEEKLIQIELLQEKLDLLNDTTKEILKPE